MICKGTTNEEAKEVYAHRARIYRRENQTRNVERAKAKTAKNRVELLEQNIINNVDVFQRE